MGGKSLRRMWTEKLSAETNFSTKDRGQQKSFPLVSNFNGEVIGIDASLRGTGIAVVSFDQTIPKLLFSTKIACSRKLSFSMCLEKIFKETAAIVDKFRLDCAAIEQTTYVQNYKISHIMGAAKGAIIVALMGKKLDIAEYPPLRVKQSVTGVGRASKEQVRRTVCNILRVSHSISYDESDAIAVALCHAWTRAKW
jgi:crossover junction endodeoxyribonuclease RuvC